MKKAIFLLVVLVSFAFLGTANAALIEGIYTLENGTWFQDFQQNLPYAEENSITNEWSTQANRIGGTLKSSYVLNGITYSNCESTWEGSTKFVFDGLQYSMNGIATLEFTLKSNSSSYIGMENGALTTSTTEIFDNGTLWNVTLTRLADEDPALNQTIGGVLTYHGGSTYNAQLEIHPTVPVPTAVWLLGSGLVGLVGVRRKLRK